MLVYRCSLCRPRDSNRFRPIVRSSSACLLPIWIGDNVSINGLEIHVGAGMKEWIISKYIQQISLCDHRHQNWALLTLWRRFSNADTIINPELRGPAAGTCKSCWKVTSFLRGAWTINRSFSNRARIRDMSASAANIIRLSKCSQRSEPHLFAMT